MLSSLWEQTKCKCLWLLGWCSHSSEDSVEMSREGKLMLPLSCGFVYTHSMRSQKKKTKTEADKERLEESKYCWLLCTFAWKQKHGRDNDPLEITYVPVPPPCLTHSLMPVLHWDPHLQNWPEFRWRSKLPSTGGNLTAWRAPLESSRANSRDSILRNYIFTSKRHVQTFFYFWEYMIVLIKNWFLSEQIANLTMCQVCTTEMWLRKRPPLLFSMHSCIWSKQTRSK